MTLQKFLPYTRQSIDATDSAEVSSVLLGDIITRGPKVEEFEKNVADYCGARFGVAFNSGSSALEAAYSAAKVSSFDHIITTPNSFVATAVGGVRRGARLTFTDIDINTGNLDIAQAAEKASLSSSRGRPILIPVHFAGIPVDMQALERTIKNPDAVIIEDAAHALGSTYHDGVTRVGSCQWSQMTTFSFHPAKTITTGEGGMVTTNDEDLFHLLRRFRNNGIERDPRYLEGEVAPWYYEVQECTGNYNFTEMQAALGLSQMRRLPQFVAKRKELMGWYRTGLFGTPHLRMFSSLHDGSAAYHLCVVQINFETCRTSRKEFMDYLKEKGIGTQVHYIPLYRHPFFRRGKDLVEGEFPNMETFYARALSLPFYYDLTKEDVFYVCRTIKEMLLKG